VVRQCAPVDESVPSQQGLKRDDVGVDGDRGVVDESVPSQQGLKPGLSGRRRLARAWSMSPFHHNKD